MKIFGTCDIGKTPQTLKDLEKGGMRVCDSITLAWDFLGLSHLPEPPRAQSLNPGWLWELAMEKELFLLHRELPRELEKVLLQWLKEVSPGSILVRTGKEDLLGINWVRSKADLIRAIQEARASAYFHYFTTGEKDSLLLTAFPKGVGRLEPIVQGHPSWRSLSDHPFQYHIRKESKEVLATLSWKSIDWNLPLNSAEPPAHLSYLELRMLLGRIYNRVILPNDPMEWIQILLFEDSPQHFLSAANLRYGEAVGQYYDFSLAPSAIKAPEKKEHQFAKSSPSSLEGEGNLAVRQIIGKSGAPGFRLGLVSYDLGTNGDEVLIAKELTPAFQGQGMAAIVEVQGCGFGAGTSLAHRLGIPHIYQARQASDIPHGSMVEVDGFLGIVTVTNQD